MKFYTDELLDNKRLLGDAEADNFIKAIFSDNEEKKRLYTLLQSLRHNSQVDEFKSTYINNELFNARDRLPKWTDSRNLHAGSAFFAKHAQVILNMLGLLSLPYCYAGANGAMVLNLSDRMRNDIGKRLIETGEFVWDVMAPNAFDKDGNGFAAILKVRLMHAAVRFYTLQDDKWDAAFGFPVNQEDMAGTNLSFSLIVIRGLRKFGFHISYDEQQSFMHLWNIIGSMLGVNDELLPKDGKQAFELEEAIRLRQFRPSVQGCELTASLITYFKSVTKGGQISNNEIPQVIRYLTGDDVANILGLPNEALSLGKIQILRTINFLKPSVNNRFAYQQQLKNFRRSKETLLQ